MSQEKIREHKEPSEGAYLGAILNISDVGLETCRHLLDQFSEPKEAWEFLLKGKGLDRLTFLSSQAKKSIASGLREDGPYSLQDAMDDCHIKAITYRDRDFPQPLKSIYNPPLVLFYRGNINLLTSERIVAMVGARKASVYGRNVAHYLGKQLASHGVVIVSGGAKGIDRFSHEGALQGKGETVAVLGCGIDVTYPRENGRLFQEILAGGGLLISEYPPHTQPLAHHFPMRNRIIEGLAKGVIVVEAKASSGSLITADMAINDGRDVFAVPGNILDSQAAGNHWLIRQGAITVTCPEDVLDFYGWTHMDSGREAQAVLSFSLDEKAVWDSLRTDKTRQVDDIIEMTGLSMQVVLQALLSLEMNDMIEKIPSQGYIRQGQ